MTFRTTVAKTALGLALGVGVLLPTAAGASPLIPQTITFASPSMIYSTFGSSSFWHVYVKGGASGNPVVLNVDPSSTSGCTYSPTTGDITFNLPKGTCILNGNQAGNATYAAAPQAQMFFIYSLPHQSLLIKTDVPTLRVGMTYQFTATDVGGTNNPVVFSRSSTSTSGCVVSPDGTTVFKAPTGWCNILAIKAGNSQYATAQSSWGFMVHPALTGTTTTTTPRSTTTTSTTPVGTTGDASTIYYTIQFTSGTKLTPLMKRELNSFASSMKTMGALTLTLNGYYNQTKSALNADKMSTELAINVSRYLKQRLSDIKFTKKIMTIISGHGATMFRLGPPTSTKNRRVELAATN